MMGIPTGAALGKIRMEEKSMLDGALEELTDLAEIYARREKEGRLAPRIKKALIMTAQAVVELEKIESTEATLTEAMREEI
jgi:hypothetical protein